MNIRAVSHFVSLMLAVVGMGIAFCWLLSIHYGDSAAAQNGLLTAGLITIAAGATVALATRGENNLKRRDGLGIVAFGWLFVTLFGALPYLLCGTISDPVSAFFESMSGFTTTGSSVLSNLEELPRGILFWRSLTHLLGGMGILIMFIAILPFVGAGGVQLYKTESTGLFAEKLTPRIADTARIVFGVYVLLNVACTMALKLAGLSWYDAVCNAFGAIATGGFSTRSESIAAFNSPLVEWIIIFFMFVSGISFVLHFRAIRGNFRGYLLNKELRFYTITCIAASLLAAVLVAHHTGRSVLESLREAFFQTISLFSTTGYITTDYDPWPLAIKIMFLTLMIVGACAGSTSGAIKSVRVVVVAKAIARQFRALLYPSAVQSIKLECTVVDKEGVEKAFTYVVAYLAIIAVATFLLGLFTPDLTTAVSSVIACLGGVGPGMAGAGPTETYAHFPAAAKGILIACMLLGRLEIYAVFIVLTPGFWKR